MSEDSPESTTDSSQGNSSKRLTGAEWAEAQRMWRSGQYKLKDISKEFGVSANGLHSRFKRHNVVRGEDSNHYEEAQKVAAIEEAARASAEREAKIRERAADTKDFLLKAVDAMSRKGLSSVSDAIKAGSPLSAALDDVRTAKEAVLLFKNAVETVDKLVPPQEVDEDELPTLTVERLSPEDIREIEEEQREQEAIFGVSEEEISDDLDVVNGD